MSDSNTVYEEMETIDLGLNLFIARVSDMSSMQKSDMKGNLDI